MAFLSSKKYSLIWKMACSVAIFFLLISPLAPLSTGYALAADPVAPVATASQTDAATTAPATGTATGAPKIGKGQEADANAKPPAVSIWELAVNPLESILTLAAYLLYVISQYILGPIVSLIGALFNWSLSLTMHTMQGSIIKKGWDYSLSLANMLFALIFLAIAIGTILQLTSFHWKKTLPLLLITILLINFSFVIGEIVIDFSNFFAVYFASEITKEGGGDLSKRLVGSIGLNTVPDTINSIVSPKEVKERQQAAAGKKIVEGENGVGSFTEEVMEVVARSTGIYTTDEQGNETVTTQEGVVIEEGPSPDMESLAFDIFLKMGFVIVFQLIVIFILAAGVVYMFLRTFQLWILLMLAPLAWITLAIPGQKQRFNDWWKRFARWAFFAPVYLFFTFFALMVADGDFSFGSSVLQSHSGIRADQIIQLLAVGFIMIWGVFMAERMGIKAGNFVIDAGNTMRKSAAQKFREVRGKSSWSAENIGKRFGAVGARMTAPFGITEQGKRIGESYRAEKLDKQQKKENVYNARQELKNYREGGEGYTALKNAERAAKEARKQLKELREKEMQGTLTVVESLIMASLEDSAKQHQEDINNLRKKELEILNKIRAGTASKGQQFSAEDIEKFVKSQKEGAPSETAKS